jgi:glycosyltransferase involved in cell wall biosynthesis
MVSISVVIITYNEEKNIGRCIDSVKDIADEIVVIDSYSTDKTKLICVTKGARFIERAFEGFTAQKNFAVGQASHDFVLALDADEYLSPELKQSILQVKSNWKADGFQMNRLNSYAGKWIKSCGWYPDTKIRLWNRQKGSWQGGLVHESVVMNKDSTVDDLKGDLLHTPYENASQLITKMQQQYADLFAQENANRKKVTTFQIGYKTIASFLKSYILKGGIFDGYEGLLISVSNANGVFYKYAKLLEKNRALKKSVVGDDFNQKTTLQH